MFGESLSEILSFQLSQRKQSNPAYSMRAFARDLQISSSQLSMILSGKRGLSVASAKKNHAHPSV